MTAIPVDTGLIQARAAADLHFDDRARSWWDTADTTALFYHDSPPGDAARAVSLLRRTPP